jgi:hypothetical protein
MRHAVLVLRLSPLIAGCVGAGTMRAIAPDAGLEARYTLPVETVRAGLDSALRTRGLRLEEEAWFDSTTTVVLASRGASFFSYGEYVRVSLQRSNGPSQTSARVVARSRYALDLSGRADRSAPRLLQALDGALGAGAVGPQPGDRVRGRRDSGDGRYVMGLAAVVDGALHLSPDRPSADPPIPMTALTDVAVFRGSYSHRAEGATIGMLVGLVGGMLVGYAAEPTDSYRGSAAALGGLVGTAAGALLGAGAGELARTQVWSEVGSVR